MKRNTDQSSRNVFSDPFLSFNTLKYGELHLKQDQTTGLFAVIAIHSTVLGPALGGCRFIPYPDIQSAIIDALRLAQGMSYKSAICGLPFGGGKAVIMAPPDYRNRKEILQGYAQFVQDLGGRYITAEDSGTTVADMDLIKTITPYVTGNSEQKFLHKNPAPITALGLRRGIEAAVQFKLQQNHLADLHVCILGLGQVGYHLAKELHQLGARLTVYDVNPQAMQRCVDEFHAQTATAEQIDKIPCDIFAPCALSDAIRWDNVDQLNARIVAGSANNQLADPALAQRLQQRDILYAPDYVVNAGGLIHVAAQYQHLNEQQAFQQVNRLYDVLMGIFVMAAKENCSTLEIANRMAEERLYS